MNTSSLSPSDWLAQTAESRKEKRLRARHERHAFFESQAYSATTALTFDETDAAEEYAFDIEDYEEYEDVDMNIDDDSTTTDDDGSESETDSDSDSDTESDSTESQDSLSHSQSPSQSYEVQDSSDEQHVRRGRGERVPVRGRACDREGSSSQTAPTAGSVLDDAYGSSTDNEEAAIEFDDEDDENQTENNNTSDDTGNNDNDDGFTNAHSAWSASTSAWSATTCGDNMREDDNDADDEEMDSDVDMDMKLMNLKAYSDADDWGNSKTSALEYKDAGDLSLTPRDLKDMPMAMPEWHSGVDMGDAAKSNSSGQFCNNSFARAISNNH